MGGEEGKDITDLNRQTMRYIAKKTEFGIPMLIDTIPHIQTIYC